MESASPTETFRSLPLPRDGSKEMRGGYDCQLVSPPPSHIQTECSVCLHILKEPCITSCCGHKFCRECIELVKTGGKNCPLCNTPDFSFMIEQSLDRTLKDLDIACSFKAKGCEWSGKLRELEHHLNRSYSIENQLIGCQYVEVECMYHQCGESLQRRHMSAHQNNMCKKRPFYCGYCQEYVSTFEDVTDNHYAMCSSYPVACPNNCSECKMERRLVERHLKVVCPVVVVNCPFHYAGCEVALPRRDMVKHTQDISSHFLLLGSFTQKLAHENKELHEHIVRIEEEASKKEKALLDKVSKLSSVCCISNHFIQHCEMLGTGCETECAAVVLCSTTSNAVEMELRNMYFSILPFQFRIEKFLSYKRGPVEYSLPYCTHSFGYKFRLKVFRAQYSKVLSLDAFTSLYVDIMPGPFDEKLKWPFKGSFTIQIVNQLGDCNHYEKTVCFDDSLYVGDKTRPDESSYVTCGLKPFIYHKELRYEHCKAGRKTHYLRDGSLHVHITKIDVY